MDDPSSGNGPDMVLTLRAAERLRAVLEETGETDCRLRIEVTGAEEDPDYVFSFEDHPAHNDVELDFVHVGVVLDLDSRRRLRGREVDYRNDAHGERFVIRRRD